VNPWWVLGGLYALTFVGLLICMRRALREPLERDRIIAAAQRTADQDDLELLWDLPDYDPDAEAGFDRLRQAIQEHREEDS